MTARTARCQHSGVIEGVIYDMDGVIVDSEPLWKRAMIEVWARVGLAITEDDCRETQGLRIDEVARVWAGRHGWSPRATEEVAAATVGRVVDLIRTESGLLPGVAESLRFFEDRGVPCAIASSSDLVLIDAVVDSFGLRGCFGPLVSAEHEDYGKPHPGVYLSAAQRLGVEASRCLAIEDSPNGVISAKAARMRVLCVPDPALRDDPRVGVADVVVDSMAHFGADVWSALNAAPPG